MKAIELSVLNGEQAGLSVVITPGTYRVLRRSDADYDIRSTMVSTMAEQYQLSQEDFELATANLTRSALEDGLPVVAFDAFDQAEDVTLVDERISMPHAIILADDHRAMLIDAGSRNGCFVNGERVGASIIAPGDLLRCGVTRLHVRQRPD